MTILHARCGNCEGRPDEDRAHCDWHEAATDMMAACVKLVDYDGIYSADSVEAGELLKEAVELARVALNKATT